MKKYRVFFVVTFLFCAPLLVTAQGLTHEIGILGGPLTFRPTTDFKKNIDNISFGIGLAHYLGFAGNNCDCLGTKSYFSTHFKVRTELDYEHIKSEILKQSATSNIIEFGPSLEWYPFKTSTYNDKTRPFAPFLGLGVHYVHYDPTIDDSSYDPKHTKKELEKLKGKISAGNTYSIVGNIGTRYRLNNFGDLIVDARIHYYGSNQIDGGLPLQKNEESSSNYDEPNPDARSFNDFTAWLTVGYVYYF